MKKYCKLKVEEAKIAKSELIKNIESNPLYTLKWSQSTIETITMGKLCKHILEELDNERNEKEILQGIQKCVITNSKWLNNSNSVLSNLLEDIEQQMRGEILARLGHIL